MIFVSLMLNPLRDHLTSFLLHGLPSVYDHGRCLRTSVSSLIKAFRSCSQMRQNRPTLNPFSLPARRYWRTVLRVTRHCSAICSGVYTVPCGLFIRFRSSGTDGVAFAPVFCSLMRTPP